MKKLLMMMVLSCTLLVSNVSAFAVEKIDEVKPKSASSIITSSTVISKTSKTEVKTTGYLTGSEVKSRKVWVHVGPEIDAYGVVIKAGYSYEKTITETVKWRKKVTDYRTTTTYKMKYTSKVAATGQVVKTWYDTNVVTQEYTRTGPKEYI